MTLLIKQKNQFKLLKYFLFVVSLKQWKLKFARLIKTTKINTNQR